MVVSATVPLEDEVPGVFSGSVGSFLGGLGVLSLAPYLLPKTYSFKTFGVCLPHNVKNIQHQGAPRKFFL